MWLRDFLPEHENFKNSRVMTFGYDSDLTDRSTVMELENWAETLLQSLDEVRTGKKEKERPLLFVSHSLGGLVVRKAMARLYPTPNCQNIKLSQCGIVFLATPHSGSTKADWSSFLVATAHTIGGVRAETVKTLQSFNTASVWDTAAFLNLEPCPPFRCFAEGLKMRVKGTNQHIVTQASATLGKYQAHMIMDVDHSSICKFKSRLGALVTVTMALRELLSEVTTGGVQQPKAQPDRRMFGQPRFLAHTYPPDRGFWWEGTKLSEIQHQLTSTRTFFGRSKELSTLGSSLATNGTRPSLTVVKGIAGIGKTELLLQFAATQRGRRNVFFLGSQDRETIDSVLSKLSTRIGFDMIEGSAENQERWRSTPVAERVQIFIAWLGDTCNKDSIFIIDDIEAFGYSKIPVILRYPAQHVLISTRDSNLIRADRVFRELRSSPLGHDDTVRILQSTLESLSANPVFWDSLGSIARRIQGHPLAARNAIPFAMEYLATYKSPGAAFSELFESQDPEERKVFL
ncbi:Protein SERAC1 [Fusarium oxysporum f. sp. cubense]|uniref:Protein SERAC1 n=1 Tax=Fusarium oxysporum f. sp. cubense TaxID=61366 RepID=A0A559L903_FUSOC|nr:Protein SERAC1 [Fusarium oxysporum f. sp. cubense]